MLPITLTALIWLAGLFCAWLLKRSFARAPLPLVRQNTEDDRYATAAVRGRVVLSLLAAAAFCMLFDAELALCRFARRSDRV